MNTLQLKFTHFLHFSIIYLIYLFSKFLCDFLTLLPRTGVAWFAPTRPGFKICCRPYLLQNHESLKWSTYTNSIFKHV